MKNLIYIAFCACLLMGCSKALQIDAPTLTVDVLNARNKLGDTLVFKLGDTCRFAFGGYADNVSFYSGQSGMSYQYHTRTEGLGTTTMSFSSTMQFGTQANTLKVLAFKNLAGLDSASIVNAAWTDITSRAILATTATATPSGTINLSDLVTNINDNLTIAFKYNGTGGSTQRTWVITNYTVNNVLPDVTYNLGAIATDASYWKIFKVGASVVNWTASTTQLSVVGGVATNPNNESWIVSKPLYVGRVSADVPTAILKSINSAELQNYMFKYAAIGVYKATFAISNVVAGSVKDATEEFVIKIVQ